MRDQLCGLPAGTGERPWLAAIDSTPVHRELSERKQLTLQLPWHQYREQESARWLRRKDKAKAEKGAQHLVIPFADVATPGRFMTSERAGRLWRFLTDKPGRHWWPRYDAGVDHIVRKLPERYHHGHLPCQPRC